MCCAVAHLASEAGLVTEYVHAVGGVHYLLALVAVGFVAMAHGRVGPRFGAVVFAASVAVGALATPLVAAPAVVARVGPVVALAFGVAVAVSPKTPGWVIQLLAGSFGFSYGLVQGHHLLQQPVDVVGLSVVFAAVVATAGSYVVGATAGWAVEDPWAFRTTVALGGAVIGVVILVLARG